MTPYTSRTGTLCTLEDLRRRGWRLLLTPADLRIVSAAYLERLTQAFQGYAIDNGAWAAHVRGDAWPEGPFLELVERFGADADWIVAPDIVEGGLESLELSESWLHRLPGRRLIAVQDGMAPWDLEPLLGGEVGIFVGGSTGWKISSLPWWGRAARDRGAYLHLARCNSRLRLTLAAAAGCHSFDGTAPIRDPRALGRIDHARRQLALCLGPDLERW